MTELLSNVELGTTVNIPQYGEGTVIANGLDVDFGSSPMRLVVFKELPQPSWVWDMPRYKAFVWEKGITKSFVPLEQIKSEYKYGYWFHDNAKREVEVVSKQAQVEKESQTLTLDDFEFGDKVKFNLTSDKEVVGTIVGECGASKLIAFEEYDGFTTTVKDHVCSCSESKFSADIGSIIKDPKYKCGQYFFKDTKATLVQKNTAKATFDVDVNKPITIEKVPAASTSNIIINGDEVVINAGKTIKLNAPDVEINGKLIGNTLEIIGVDYGNVPAIVMMYDGIKWNSVVMPADVVKSEILPTEEPENNEVKDAAYRIAGHQINKGIKASILSVMQKSGHTNIKALSEVLDTEVGGALLSMLAGYMLTYSFNDKRIGKLAQEFRVAGLSNIGNAAFDSITQYITPVIVEALQNNTVRVEIDQETTEEASELIEAVKTINNEDVLV